MPVFGYELFVAQLKPATIPVGGNWKLFTDYSQSPADLDAAGSGTGGGLDIVLDDRRFPGKQNSKTVAQPGPDQALPAIPAERLR